MANITYNQGIKLLLSAATAWDSSAVYKAMLERSTSTYVPDRDHANLAAFTGFVEISVASYSRKNVVNRTVTVDNANDEVVLDCDDIAFGNLESGQTVKSIIIYQHNSDTDQSLNIPLLRIDTDAGGLLPRALGGGQFTVVINAQGLYRYKEVVS